MDSYQRTNLVTIRIFLGQNLKNDAHAHAKIIVGTSPTSFGRAFRRLPGNTLARCDFCVFERVRGSSIGHRRLGARVSAEHTRYRIQQKETLKKHFPKKTIYFVIVQLW